MQENKLQDFHLELIEKYPELKEHITPDLTREDVETLRQAMVLKEFLGE